MTSRISAIYLTLLLIPILAQSQLGEVVPIGVPRLMAHVDDQQTSIELEAVDATVKIHGFLVETTLILTFHNRDARTLEAEFQIALPEGATVSGYGLDVEGVLVDGVVVEKEKARIAFDREVAKEVDPGLVEWLGGNLFSTRIYPVEGRSRRTVKIQYVNQLNFERGEAAYHFPLASFPEMKEMQLRVEIFNPEIKPRIKKYRSLGVESQFESGVFAVEAEERPFDPTEDLEIRLDTQQQSMILFEERSAGTYAFAVADLEGPSKGEMSHSGSLKPNPERLVLFWDASYSRLGSDPREVLEVIEVLLNHWRVHEVALVVFRDQKESPEFFAVRKEGTGPLLSRLESLDYDGATGWRDLEVPGGFEADVALLVSDGRINFGSRNLPDLGLGVLIFNPSTDGDHSILRHLAESTGGSYFDLHRQGVESIFRELSEPTTTLRGVSVETGKVREIFAPVGRPVRGPTLITGLLEGEEASLRLNYATGDGHLNQKRVRLKADSGMGLVSRFWSQQKLDRLVMDSERNREAILELGREHSLVTPRTSLLVLETLDQYLEYEIEPPASLPEMRLEYLELLEKSRLESSEDLEDYLEDLRESWEGYLAWSEKPFEFPPPGSISLDRPPFEEEPEDRPSEDSPVMRRRAVSGESSAAQPGQDAISDYLEVGLEEVTDELIVVTSVAGSGPAGEAVPEILVKPWTPDLPYLEELRKAPIGGEYRSYLRQRQSYGASPAFYLDCARFFAERGLKREASLVASTVLELGRHGPNLIRAAANIYLQMEEWDRAVLLFEQLILLAPELPQSKRDLALTLIARGEAKTEGNPTEAQEDYWKAASLLRQVALQPWGEVASPLQRAYLEDGRFEEMGRIALVEYGWALAKWRDLNHSANEPLTENDEPWVDIPDADLRIVLTWEDPFADMDLWVVEPSGEKVFYSNPKSKIGGLLSEDCTQGLGPESYVIQKAMPGTYRIFVDYFAGIGPELFGPVTVQTTIIKGFGRDEEKVERLTIRLDSEKDTVEIGSVTIE